MPRKVMLKHFIISDEANEEFNSELLDGSSVGLSAYKRVPMQFRTYKIALFGGGQVLSQFDASYTNNVVTKGVFKVSDYQQARAAARWIGLPDESVAKVQNLGVGQLFFHTDGISAPTLIKVDPIARRVDQAEAATFQKEQLAKLEQEIVYAPLTDDAIEPISYLDILGERGTAASNAAPTSSVPIKIGDEYVRFLQAVAENSDKSITQLYDLLGL